MEKLIVASNNKAKIAEIKAILSDLYDVRSLKDEGVVSDPEETGATFAENALIKAKAAHDLTGAATLADDSGLVVDALGGAPGVHSARYSGTHGNDDANNKLLLKNLEGKENRKACFMCAIALIKSNGVCPVIAFIFLDKVERDTFSLSANITTSSLGSDMCSSTILKAFSISCSSDETKPISDIEPAFA